MLNSHLTNSRLLQALKRQPVDRAPVWIMRQAGRYLPEYREVRAQAGSFVNLMKNPELCCQVTLQPLARFPLDAAILFSDILTIPDALGRGLHFEPGEGPIIAKPVRSEAHLAELPKIEVAESLSYVAEAVTLIKQALNGQCPLLGFSGSPWTLATYMVEGGSSKNFSIIKAMMYKHPELLLALLDKLSDVVIDYCVMQAEAGVDALMLFDSWGGVLTPHAYQQFSAAQMSKIVRGIKARLGADFPVIVFTKNGGQWLEHIATIGADGVGIDWTTDIGDAFDRIGDKVAIQGNLDPSVLYGSDALIEEEVQRIVNRVNGRPGHLFNLGHGIHPEIQPEKVAVMINALIEASENCGSL